MRVPIQNAPTPPIASRSGISLAGRASMPGIAARSGRSPERCRARHWSTIPDAGRQLVKARGSTASLGWPQTLCARPGETKDIVNERQHSSPNSPQIPGADFPNDSKKGPTRPRPLIPVSNNSTALRSFARVVAGRVRASTTSCLSSG